MLQLSRTALPCSLAAVALMSLAGLTAHAQANSNLRIMPLGDSITAGYKSTTGNGYREPLFTALSTQVGVQDFVGKQMSGTMADPDNEGHSGYQIGDLAALTNASLTTYKPNIVLLDAGINDLRANNDNANAPARLGALIDQILAAEPDATVLVAQLIVNSTSSVESEVETFNNQLPAIVQARSGAGKHVALVNMSALTLADLSDGLHPNDTGYQLMGNAWDAAILQAIANHWIADPLAGSASRPTGNIYSGVSGICLDDLGGSGTAGAKVDGYGCNASVAQQWNVNNGSISVNGLCLDVVGASTANGAPVDVWNCTGAANQVWKVQNGTIVNPTSGRCLTVPGGSTSWGTQLDIETCTGAADQQWRVPVEGAVTSGIAGKCLDAPAGSAADGTPANSYSCNSTAAQQWHIVNNTLTFDGKCLDIKGGGTNKGTLVQLYHCHGGSNQQWTAVNGTLVNPASGLCLDIPGGSTADGVQLDVWNCTGGSNQQWTVPAGTPQS